MKADKVGQTVLVSGFLAMVLTCAGCGTDPAGNNGYVVVPPATKEVRLTSYHNCELMIGKGPGNSMEYEYDARGPGSLGTMSLNCAALNLEGENLEACRTYEADLEPGEVLLFFDADDSQPEKLYLFDEYVYIDILPTDMIGTMNFCTGEVEYAFDALFEQVVFGESQGALSVVSVLTTGTVSGDYWTKTGRPLDEDGNLQLVSVAVVPPTGDPVTDGILDLPTDSVSVMESHLDFPQGRFPCPGEPAPGAADEVRMRVLKEGVLSMAFLGNYTNFSYDGKGSDGTAAILGVDQGVVQVEFVDFQIPILQFIPGSDTMGVRIEPNLLAGEIDLCTGRVNLEFDAKFTPFMGDEDLSPMSVVTTMKTGQSEFIHHTEFAPLTGEPMDRWGDAYLVGIADVPPVSPEKPGSEWINLLMELPNDAVCELPVHLDFLGGEPPRCPR